MNAPELSIEERAVVDRFEAADEAPESYAETVHRVALALQDASLDEGVVLVGYEARTTMTAAGIVSRDSCYRLATAAIAALDPS